MNNYGQLGQKEHANSRVPNPVIMAEKVDSNGKQSGKKLNVKDVAAGTWHSLAVTEHGEVPLHSSIYQIAYLSLCGVLSKFLS